MSKRQYLSLIGVWIMIFTFLGFPSESDKIIALISGFIIVAISYNLPQENKKNNKDMDLSSSSAFIENENNKQI